MKHLFFIVALALLIMLGCSSKASMVSDIDFLRSLRKRSPAVDARQAINNNRIRFLAVGGYSSHVPGVDMGSCIVDRAMVDIIPGTGDVWATFEQQELQKVAEKYAFGFNSVIKAELDRRKVSVECFRVITK